MPRRKTNSKAAPQAAACPTAPEAGARAHRASLQPETAARITLALLLALAFGLLFRSAWSAGNLEIVPDSVEYAVGAQRFAATGRFDIEINHARYPSRYLPAFPVLALAPLYRLVPGEIGIGIYVVLAFALAAVVAAWSIGRHLAGSWGGALSALALIAAPGFHQMSREIMSDVPAMALCLAACAMMVRMRPGASALRWAGVGVLIALAGAMRQLTLIAAFPAMAQAVRPVTDRWRRVAAVAAPVALSILATAEYNRRTFGSWSRTGYHYWCPVPYDYPSLTFGARYLAANLAALGAIRGIALIVLGALGAVILMRRHTPGVRPALAFLAGGCAPVTVIHLFYFASDARFHMLGMAVLATLAGAGLGSLVPARLERAAWVVPLIPLLFLNAGLRRPDEEPRRRIVAEALQRATPPDAVIVTDLDAAYLDPIALRGTHRTVLPVSRTAEYAGKLVAVRRIDNPVPAPRSAIDHRCAGLVRGGARSPMPVTALTDPGVLQDLLRSGRPVFLDTAFGPARLRLEGAHRDLAAGDPVPGIPWLLRLRLPDAGAAGAHHP